MVRYEYRCEQCEHRFEVRERISEHEPDTVHACPECGNEETQQLMSPFLPDTSSKT